MSGGTGSYYKEEVRYLESINVFNCWGLCSKFNILHYFSFNYLEVIEWITYFFKETFLSTGQY